MLIGINHPALLPLTIYGCLPLHLQATIYFLSLPASTACLLPRQVSDSRHLSSCLLVLSPGSPGQRSVWVRQIDVCVWPQQRVQMGRNQLLFELRCVLGEDHRGQALLCVGFLCSRLEAKEDRKFNTAVTELLKPHKLTMGANGWVSKLMTPKV